MKCTFHLPQTGGLQVLPDVPSVSSIDDQVPRYPWLLQDQNIFDAMNPVHAGAVAAITMISGTSADGANVYLAAFVHQFLEDSRLSRRSIQFGNIIAVIFPQHRDATVGLNFALRLGSHLHDHWTSTAACLHIGITHFASGDGTITRTVERAISLTSRHDRNRLIIALTSTP